MEKTTPTIELKIHSLGWLCGLHLLLSMSTFVNLKSYLLMQLIWFPINLAIIVIAYLAVIGPVMGFILSYADYIFQVWYPWKNIRFPLSCHYAPLNPKFNPRDHIICWHQQKGYNRKRGKSRVHPGRLKTSIYIFPEIISKDASPAKFQIPWIIFLMCFVVGIERFISKGGSN